MSRQVTEICKLVNANLFGQLLTMADVEAFGRSTEFYLPTDEVIEGFLDHYRISFNTLSKYSYLSDILQNHFNATLFYEFNLAFLANNFRVFSYKPGISLDRASVITESSNKNMPKVFGINGIIMTATQSEKFDAWYNRQKFVDSYVTFEEAYKTSNVLAQRILYQASYLETLIAKKKEMNDNAKWDLATFIGRQMDILSHILSYEYEFYLKTLSDKILKLDHEDRLQTFESILDEIEHTTQTERLCDNDFSIYDINEPVEDIPDDEIIRLGNGACWAITDLMDHMKHTNGLNTNRNLPKTYPSSTLFGRWSLEHDLNKVLNHPKAKESNFADWYNNRRLDEYTNLISKQTMDILRESMELLSSQGPAFDKAIKAELTERELSELRKHKGVIKSIPNKDIQQSIISKMEDVLKTYANARLNEYLEKLTKNNPKELDALKFFRPDLLTILRQCYEGLACNWYTADVLRDTYNDIARLKHIDIVIPNNGEQFIHITPTILQQI